MKEGSESIVMKGSFGPIHWFLILVLILILITGSENTKIEIQTKSPNSTVVAEGQALKLNVELNDAGDGMPMLLFIDWYFRSSLSNSVKRLLSITSDADKILSETYYDKRVSVFNNTGLLLLNTTVNDTGTYWCSVFSLPTSHQYSAVLYFNVSVEGKPRAEITCLDGNNITKGRNFTCWCYARGKHLVPSAFWLKDGQVLTSRRNLSQRLFVPNVGKDATGKYMCRAQLYSLVDEITTVIVVHYPPKIQSFKGTLSEDDSLTLTCVAEGEPKPSYSVYVSGGFNFPGDSQGVVVIKNYTSVANESFTCVAENYLGNDEWHLHGYVTLLKDKTPNEARPSVKGTKWYIILVSISIGIVAGFGILKVFQCVRGRKTKVTTKRPKMTRPGSQIPIYIDPASLPAKHCWKQNAVIDAIYIDPDETEEISRLRVQARNNRVKVDINPMKLAASNRETSKVETANACSNLAVIPPSPEPKYKELDPEKLDEEPAYQSLHVPVDVKES